VSRSGEGWGVCDIMCEVGESGEIVGNGWKWVEMGGIGWKWVEIGWEMR
jgi:hypothetical protein